MVFWWEISISKILKTAKHDGARLRLAIVWRAAVRAFHWNQRGHWLYANVTHDGSSEAGSGKRIAFSKWMGKRR